MNFYYNIHRCGNSFYALYFIMVVLAKYHSVHRQEMTKNKPASLHASNVSKENITPRTFPFLAAKRNLQYVILL